MPVCIKHRKETTEIAKDLHACDECLAEAADICLEDFGSYTPELDDEDDHS